MIKYISKIKEEKMSQEEEGRKSSSITQTDEQSWYNLRPKAHKQMNNPTTLTKEMIIKD